MADWMDGFGFGYDRNSRAPAHHHLRRNIVGKDLDVSAGQPNINYMEKKYNRPDEDRTYSSLGSGLEGLGEMFRIAGELEDMYAQTTDLTMRMQADEINQMELIKRYDDEFKAINRSEREGVSRQAGQYLSSGVKLEGSALDVMANTVRQHGEAESARMDELAHRDMIYGRQQAIHEAAIKGVKRAGKYRLMRSLVRSAGRGAELYGDYKSGRLRKKR